MDWLVTLISGISSPFSGPMRSANSGLAVIALFGMFCMFIFSVLLLGDHGLGATWRIVFMLIFAVLLVILALGTFGVMITPRGQRLLTAYDQSLLNTSFGTDAHGLAKTQADQMTGQTPIDASLLAIPTNQQPPLPTTMPQPIMPALIPEPPTTESTK